MSRIGKLPIALPAGVTVTREGTTARVKGPKGELSVLVHADIAFTIEDNIITVTRPSDEKEHRALHGLVRALLANAVTGVTSGYQKRLEIHGVGYRAVLQGKDLNLSLGFSHPVIFPAPAGITFAVEEVNKQSHVLVSGIDKELVGEVSARIRALRKPEPYKGKGVRYSGEYVRRKAGKSAAKGKKK